ncbi:MAG: DNA-protecting protein DprA [Catenibacterium mitsuokai]|jgi:DNA processing protein|uniref:DNA-protecting protein DprA n=1 Tax=Catenibacterium mitsuokai TaxID=100886 RepID=UPI002432C501|nr:DNA-protecting protein DprA [Catenibacterium mitsuokai]MCI6076630.1 DNA-protecting protein DprA [Catenibacterium mitsuokai]MDY3677560.1 DNA-protecting protein DprA [Catenibacterium mitsuokai]
MDRNEIKALMNDIYTSREAAEYLQISTQRLNQLVHDQQIIPIKVSKSVTLFWKEDLDKRTITNVSSNNNPGIGMFDINNAYVRDAILYFTIQQYFNCNDKKTCEFIEQLEKVDNFSFRSGLKNNIPYLSSKLNILEKDFYKCYLRVKDSFSKLTDDVILVKKGDGVYSKLLANTDGTPPFLFLKGNVHLLNEKSVCVVGSRNASVESMKKTEKLVKALIKRNIVVNAGLAKGIDTATHKTALENGGRTIAVIGTPINQYYPKENKDLQLSIEEKGLVVSQFPPCNPVYRWNFPTRNGTMSGISLATIIMEAGETSGALRQADYALKQGRDVLIPQSAINNSSISWPKKYIKKGAHAFKNLKEVLQILNDNEVLYNLFDNDDMEEVNNVEMD